MACALPVNARRAEHSVYDRVGCKFHEFFQWRWWIRNCEVMRLCAPVTKWSAAEERRKDLVGNWVSSSTSLFFSPSAPVPRHTRAISAPLYIRSYQNVGVGGQRTTRRPETGFCVPKLTEHYSPYIISPGPLCRASSCRICYVLSRAFPSRLLTFSLLPPISNRSVRNRTHPISAAFHLWVWLISPIT